MTSIKNQLRKAEHVGEKLQGGKRGKIPCEWLGQLDRANIGEVDLYLIGPRINAEMAEMFELSTSDWTIVSPELYQLIWEAECG